jgi:prevent-host-death family protein
LTLPSLHVYDYSSHQEVAVKELQLREVKATLSAVVDDVIDGEPCLITRRGKPEAVIVSFREWERLSRVPSFARLLMSAPAEIDVRRDATPLRDSDL